MHFQGSGVAQRNSKGLSRQDAILSVDPADALDSIPSEAYTILPVGLAERLSRVCSSLHDGKLTYSDVDESPSQHKVRLGSWHWARASRPSLLFVGESLPADGGAEHCQAAILASPADTVAVHALDVGWLGLRRDDSLSPATLPRALVLRPGLRHC